MRFTTKLATALPVALLASTVVTAAPAHADTAYYADAWYCFNLVNNTGWTLQASFAPSIEDWMYSRTDFFPGTPDQLAPGQQINNVCPMKPRSSVALTYGNSAESFTIDMSGTTNTDGYDELYMDLSNGITRQAARPNDTLTLQYTPATDPAGNYMWTNTTAFDFPDNFTLKSPQGAHQQSCSTLGSVHTTLAGMPFHEVMVLPWNDSTGASAWIKQTSSAAHLRLATDGNLEIVNDSTNQIEWSSNTAPSPGHPYAVTLKLQTDGNLALYRSATGQYMWDAKVAPVCP
jgi:hypothetical protein